MAEVITTQGDQCGKEYAVRSDLVEEKLDDVVVVEAVPSRYRGTEKDKRDMLVQGKRQEFRRDFRLLTMTGFASMVVCAWEGLLPLFTSVLYGTYLAS